MSEVKGMKLDNLLTPEHYKELKREGLSDREIAYEFWVHPQTLYWWKFKHGLVKERV